MTHEIKNHWLVHEPMTDRPISLRALKPRGSQLPLFPQNLTFRTSDFSSPEALKQAFEDDALSLNGAGYNVYTVMNPIRRDFQGDLAVKDADITDITTILIDIDRNGDTSQPATDMEIDAAFKLANEVEAYLRLKGFPNPFWVHSGNGYHLYYRINPTPKTEVTTQTVERLLAGLAIRFSNSVVGVDASVYNPSRITKVIGTIARKGVESEGRPYRMAKLV
jgi:hypothetical protein